MSVFSDGSLDSTTEGLQERLEKGISPESRAAIEKILADVGRLSNVEKLFLYLQLPTHVPSVNSTAKRTKTSNDAESSAISWMKTHLTRNARTSLLRQKVYDDYRKFCAVHHQDPVSVSDFKKILLSVFPQLTTRRLGSRGDAKHMFGGISFLMQPNAFAVPKVKLEDNDDNQESCDDIVDCVKDRSEGRSEDRANRAASRLILEWAYKLLSIPFESIHDLAVHLISKSYVSQVSEEAFTVTAGTKCVVNYKDSTEEIPMTEDATQRQLSTRHQLQRKLQERREIARQKQRMEEERSHLTTHESSTPGGATSSKQAPTSLVQAPRNPLVGISRTPGPRSDVDRNSRRPSVPAILPKTLLPKPVAGTRLDLDPRAPRRVDPPQFILLSPSATQLQPVHAAGSLVFISSSLAQNVPALDARLPIQAMVKNVGVRPSFAPARFDLPRSTSDLAGVVVSTGSLAALGFSDCLSSYRTHSLLEAGGISQGFPSMVEKNGNARVVCSVVNGCVRPVCSDVIGGGSGRQGNQFGSNVSMDFGNILKPAVFQDVRSYTLAADARSLASSVQDPTMQPHASIGAGLYAGKDHLSATSLASNPNGFLDNGNVFVIEDNDTSQNSLSPIVPSHAELLCQTRLEQLSQYSVKPPTRAATTASSLSQVSKGRGRSVPSRSSTKTVSSILDEQRCSNGAGASRALKFYNDSRNVSQILKELREKSISGEGEQGTGVPGVLDLDRTATSNPFACNPVAGIVPPGIQIVQVLPPGSAFESTGKVVPSNSTVPLQRSATSLGLQAVQPADCAKMQGLSTEGDSQSPVRRHPPGMISEVLLSSKSVVRLIHPADLTLPHLVLPAPATPKSDVAFGSCHAESSSIFSFLDPGISQVGSSPSKQTSSGGMPLLTNVNQGGSNPTSGTNFFHVTVSTSGAETGDSVNKSFVSQGIFHADSGRPLVESLKFLGVPVIMSTSESQSSESQSNCVNLQQLLLKPVDSLTVMKTFLENTVPSTQRGYGVSLSEDKGTKPGQVSVNNRGRSSVKRNIATHNYCGIKRLLLGDDRPEEIVACPPVKVEYLTGGVETGGEVVDSLLTRLHSPGDEAHPMPYKDQYAQHCTLQQLSQVSTLRRLQQAWLLRQHQGDLQPHPGSSRPASAFGDDKTGLGSLSSQGTRPSRPNTVAGVNPETYYLDTVGYEPSGEGSRGSERSTPMSGASPGSNLSNCSLYLDQSNAFMPIHITDCLPSGTAIKPLPTLGQRNQLEMEGFEVVSRPADARSLAAAFTTDARGFVPYTSSESQRVVAMSNASRSSGFAPVSSIRPLKRGGHGGAPSRQRHHSAHDFPNPCNKLLPQGIRLHDGYEDTSGLRDPTPESTTFGGITSSGLTLMPGAMMMPPVFDFQDLEAAGEVEEIIAASQESSVTSLQRSQSEPANCLPTGCTFTLEDMIDQMLNDAVTEENSSATPGSTENLSSHGGSQVDWTDCSDKRPTEKLGDRSDRGKDLPWSSSSRDRLISGVELQPSLAFSDALHCGDLHSSEFETFEHSAGGGGSFIGDGCTPPLSSQNSSPEFASEMPLFDKSEKEGLEAFPPEEDGGQSTALDTPSSLEGLFGGICGDDNENHDQSTSCNMDFSWPY